MLIVKLDYGFRLNLYLGSIFMWLISIFSRTQPKIGTNQALMVKMIEKCEPFRNSVSWKYIYIYIYNFSYIFFSDNVSCAINPCENGGQCHEAVNTIICICLTGTSGERCSYRSRLRSD